MSDAAELSAYLKQLLVRAQAQSQNQSMAAQLPRTYADPITNLAEHAKIAQGAVMVVDVADIKFLLASHAVLVEQLAEAEAMFIQEEP